MALNCPEKVLHFPNNMSIELSYKNSRTFSKCRKYDTKLVGKGYVWHQIRILHNGKGRELGTDTMLDAIFDAIEGEELYPVAYRQGKKEDSFLVRQCTKALDKLFAQKLRVQLSNGQYVHLEVWFNVGDYKFGQIAAPTKIAQALDMQYNSMDRVGGVNGILNLSDFRNHSEFFEIFINLSNLAIFEHVCQTIYRNDEKFRSLNGLNLSKNRITTLAPLRVFNGVQFAVLDLRENDLRSTKRLCRDLKEIKAVKLYLEGNPLIKSSHYPECLKPILNNFQFIDGMPAENLTRDYTPMNYEVDLECDGLRIDWANKAKLDQYKNSSEWHAVIIPDTEQEFTKEQIFDYFFITVSNEMTDLYPCYYKFSNQEHRFLVRNCFDQLKYLADTCNFEIKIPCLVTLPPSSTRGDALTDLSARVQIEKTVFYYLRMNSTPFKHGQIDPASCVEKALERRFSGMDRVLNMDNFQSTEGLENIVLNMSSSKVLSFILMQASRKFLNNCIELRLRHNKILNMNFPKALHLMDNLKAIDLTNNWIHDLSDIKDLQSLCLKSLHLDGNPLCSRYTFAGEYIKAVRQYFPELVKLDNIAMTARGNLCSQKNYLCEMKGYDFVQQFVQLYFQIYESENRSALRDMYHPRALFTMTCQFKTSIQNNRISKYGDVARNIFKIRSFADASRNVFMGPSEIIRVLMELPTMSHDIVNFSTDTTVFNEEMVVLTVHGVFVDRMSLESDLLIAFSRTFVLKPVESQMGILKCAIAYQIVNEQFNILNPTALQTKSAFRLFMSEQDDKNSAITGPEKEALFVMLKEITNLKAVWCTRCLEDAKWDFEMALEKFMSLCKRKEIPDSAFA